MPKLPTRDDLGPLPSARTGAPVASFDGSAIARGVSDLGQGIASFGADVAEVAQKQQEFDAEKKLQEFRWNEQLAFEKAKREVQPGQVDGFAEGWQQGYFKRAKAFKQSVAPNLRGAVDSELFSFERDFFLDAQKFQLDEQRRVASNTLMDAVANIYAPRARGVNTADLDGVIEDMDTLLASNPHLTPIERDEVRRDLLREIGKAHLDALTPDRIERLLSGEGAANEAISSLTASERMNYLDRAIREQEAAEKEYLSDMRSAVSKEGYDLLLNDGMTPEWLASNRDVLSASDYKTFLRSLGPDARTRKTDPQTYLRLYDLASDDPEAARLEARDLYLNGQLAKDDFNKIHGLATRTEEGPDYSSELRGYVKKQLTPDSDAPSSHYARQLDAMFAFDDWREKNPNARREEMRKSADEIIADFKRIRYASGVTELPLPKYVGKTRDKVELEDLQEARRKIIADLSAGVIDEREAASQAALLRRWMAIIGDKE